MKTETPRMMLAFVVRQCAIDLGHSPDADELANWANEQQRGRVFGRSISRNEAELILRNPERLVTIRPDWLRRALAAAARPETPAKILSFRQAR